MSSAIYDLILCYMAHNVYGMRTYHAILDDCWYFGTQSTCLLVHDPHGSRIKTPKHWCALPRRFFTVFCYDPYNIWSQWPYTHRLCFQKVFIAWKRLSSTPFGYMMCIQSLCPCTSGHKIWGSQGKTPFPAWSFERRTLIRKSLLGGKIQLQRVWPVSHDCIGPSLTSLTSLTCSRITGPVYC